MSLSICLYFFLFYCQSLYPSSFYLTFPSYLSALLFFMYLSTHRFLTLTLISITPFPSTHPFSPHPRMLCFYVVVLTTRGYDHRHLLMFVLKTHMNMVSWVQLTKHTSPELRAFAAWMCLLFILKQSVMHGIFCTASNWWKFQHSLRAQQSCNVHLELLPAPRIKFDP